MTATANKAKVGEVKIVVTADLSPDASYLEQEGLGFEERLASYQAGEWSFVGVMLQAEIKIPYGHDWIVTHIETPGLWGIEDDSGEEYFRSVADDELYTLNEMLASLNIDRVNIENPSAIEISYR